MILCVVLGGLLVFLLWFLWCFSCFFGVALVVVGLFVSDNGELEEQRL